MGLSGLGGMSGLSGLSPAVIGVFDWAQMPNVPLSRRPDIETACAVAASGQSFSSADVFAHLTTSAFWWSFEPVSLFTDVAGSVPTTTNGDVIASSKDWKNGTLVSQSNASARPSRSGYGLVFDGSDDCLQAAISLVPSDSTDYYISVVAAPLRSTTAKGGAFVKVGFTANVPGAGFGLGIGINMFDTANSSNQIGLHEHVAWVPTNTAVPTNTHAINTFLRGGGNSVLFLGGTQSAVATGSMIREVGGQLSVGGYTGSTGENRFINCEIKGLISFATQSINQLNMSNRFLSAYYGI